MKICILSTKLFTGGFTGSLLPLVKFLTESGVQVDLMLFEQPDEGEFDVSGANIIYNNTPRKEINYWVRMAKLALTPGILLGFIKTRISRGDRDYYLKFSRLVSARQVEINVSRYTRMCDLSRYDCVVSWEEGTMNCFLANKVIARRKVGYIHPDYEKAAFCARIDKRNLEKLDAVVLVSKATKDSFDRAMPSLSGRSRTVYNLMDVEEIRRKSLLPEPVWDKGPFDIVTVARIENVSKALDRARRIVKRLDGDGLDFRWYIVGDGPDRGALEEEIKNLGISGRMILLGRKDNPYPYIKNSRLFVLQSVYEGKSIAVDEALVLGVPALVTDYASATEQVRDGVNGIICGNDEDSIYRALKDLIENPETLSALREGAAGADVSRFSDITPFMRVALGQNDFV